MNICPRCGSTRVKRSHSKTLKEKVLKFFNERAYRCVNCGWRGILEGKSSRVRPYAKKYTPVQIIIIVIIIIITIMGIVYWSTREESTPVQSNIGNHTETLA